MSHFWKNPTPAGYVSLCRTCTHAHIVSGYRDSERITICDEFQPNLVVPFKVQECSSYNDKNRPSFIGPSIGPSLVGGLGGKGTPPPPETPRSATPGPHLARY